MMLHVSNIMISNAIKSSRKEFKTFSFFKMVGIWHFLYVLYVDFVIHNWISNTQQSPSIFHICILSKWNEKWTPFDDNQCLLQEEPNLKLHQLPLCEKAMLRRIIYLPFCEWLIAKLKFYNYVVYYQFMGVKSITWKFWRWTLIWWSLSFGCHDFV